MKAKKKRKQNVSQVRHQVTLDDKKSLYLNYQYRALSALFTYPTYVFIRRHFDDISNFSPLLEHHCTFIKSLDNYAELYVYGELLRFLYNSWPVCYDVVDVMNGYVTSHLPVERFVDAVGKYIFIKSIPYTQRFASTKSVLCPLLNATLNMPKEYFGTDLDFVEKLLVYRDSFGRPYIDSNDAAWLHINTSFFNIGVYDCID